MEKKTKYKALILNDFPSVKACKDRWRCENSKNGNFGNYTIRYVRQTGACSFEVAIRVEIDYVHWHIIVVEFVYDSNLLGEDNRRYDFSNFAPFEVLDSVSRIWKSGGCSKAAGEVFASIYPVTDQELVKYAMNKFFGNTKLRLSEEGETHMKEKSIKSITVNEAEKIVTVVFDDGDVKMQKCSPKDDFDASVGIAICIASHLFGSKTKFKKFVSENAKAVAAKPKAKDAKKE